MRTPEAFARLGGPQEPDAHTGDLFIRSVNWKPVIAAVHGAVMGLGLGVAFECDLVVADIDTRFQITETPRGLGGARFWSLLHTCGGGAFATEVALTGRFFSAEEAHKAGIVCAVAPDGLRHRTCRCTGATHRGKSAAERAVGRARAALVHGSGGTHGRGLHRSDEAVFDRGLPRSGRRPCREARAIRLQRPLDEERGELPAHRRRAPGTQGRAAACIAGPTISDVLRAHLAEQSNAPAVWVAPQEYRSFREVFEIVGQIAQAVRSQVETAHARIAFATPRGSAGLFGFLSAVEVGTCCPLDAKLTGREFSDALVALEPDVLLVAEPDPAVLAAARAAGIPCVGFRLDTSQSDCTVRTWPSRKACEGRAMRAPLLLRGEEAPAILMRTSGTTADPKLVGLSHANVIAATVAMASVFQLVPDDICLTPMPLHHVHGLIAGALSALAAGSSIHCCESFSPHAFDAALRELLSDLVDRGACLASRHVRLLREQGRSSRNIDVAPISLVLSSPCAFFGSHAGGPV